jgi:tyrosyl-tRNA synthetase
VDIDERIKLIINIPSEEIVTLEELRNLLQTHESPKHYIGLEISGALHLGSLIVVGSKINDLIKAGVKCTIFLADWHSYINNKFQGDWNRIKKAAEYYFEAFKFYSPGAEIILGSKLYEKNDKYWIELVKFCKHISLARNTRCLTIMGRTEREKLDFAQYLYPPMQAVDMKAMNIDIAHSGMDQRKVHMLAREVFRKLKWKVPIAIHHHLLPGLEKPEQFGFDEDENMDKKISSKMSKSKPSSCINIHDSSDIIRRKLNKAWCIEGEEKDNPVLEIVKYIIMREGTSFNIDRPSKFGGPITFTDYNDLRKEYLGKKIHPFDLKNAVALALDKIISPIRSYMQNRKDLLDVFENNN